MRRRSTCALGRGGGGGSAGSRAVWGTGVAGRGEKGEPGIGPTWAGAVRVHGGLVALVVAVIFTIALPLAGAQTASVGTAELVGAAGWVLWGRRQRVRLVASAPPIMTRAGPVSQCHGPRLTTLGGLIGAIGTVTVVVTHKVLGDALAVLAHKLAVVAGVVVHCRQSRT